jgi:hypothetical protein
MAGFAILLPLRMVAMNQLQEVFFCPYMSNAHKIINISLAKLASIFHNQALFYAIASPATRHLVTIIFGCAKAIKISFSALDCFNQLLFRKFPGILNIRLPCLFFNL